VLLLIFQFIFSVAEYPMNWIDGSFTALNAWLKSVLPQSALSDLLTEGIIAGIGGVVIFIPQIAILFAFIAVLEESGYMSRVVYLMDKPMRLFGLNGKSVVPLISGAACAVPAIMSARVIDSYKERLITIFVTPFISCSARLPVYIIIIALVIPQGTFLGFSYKGLTLMGLYLLGILAALLTATAMSLILKTNDKALFLIDLPSYRMPRWKNVGITVYQKSGSFVMEAGKIILAISVILWALASYGPPAAMKAAEQKTEKMLLENPELNKEEIRSAQKLEASFIGHFGHFIEPVIRPLGYDWKIGIALITSFAAREVFVGTLGTIYSVGEQDFDKKLVDKMRNETFRDGNKVFNLASGFSLLVFYVFAMQCMSTVAIVYRETGGWKWPLIQLIYMSCLAWAAAFVTYNLLS
jgi:ferrous iron transport protein B